MLVLIQSNWNPPTVLVRMKNGAVTLQKSLAAPHLNTKLPYDPDISLLE